MSSEKAKVWVFPVDADVLDVDGEDLTYANGDGVGVTKSIGWAKPIIPDPDAVRMRVDFPDPWL